MCVCAWIKSALLLSVMKSQLWGEQFLKLNRCMSVSLLQQCTRNHLRPSRRRPQWSRSAHQQGNTLSDTKSIYIFAVFISCSVLEDSVCSCKKTIDYFQNAFFFTWCLWSLYYKQDHVDFHSIQRHFWREFIVGTYWSNLLHCDWCQ